MNRSFMYKAWINQPSKLQDFHKFHGRCVLVCHPIGSRRMARAYFEEDIRVSIFLPCQALSPGWPAEARAKQMKDNPLQSQHSCTIKLRCRVLVNTDQQRRCYYGVHAKSEWQWTEWAVLEEGIQKDKAQERLDYWIGLNNYAVSQRGEGARREFMVVDDVPQQEAKMEKFPSGVVLRFINTTDKHYKPTNPLASALLDCFGFSEAHESTLSELKKMGFIVEVPRPSSEFMEFKG